MSLIGIFLRSNEFLNCLSKTCILHLNIKLFYNLFIRRIIINWNLVYFKNYREIFLMINELLY